MSHKRPHCQPPVDPEIYGLQQYQGDTPRSRQLRQAFASLSKKHFVRTLLQRTAKRRNSRSSKKSRLSTSTM
jgi:hypothetical protein